MTGDTKYIASKDQDGFATAFLDTEVGAKMVATWNGLGSFKLSMTETLDAHDEEYGYLFMAGDCREAADFFLKLAEECERREKTDQ